MTPSTGAVFLSYASEDSDAVSRIANALKTAGIEVWFDRSELRGGDAWDRQIRTQIHDCRLFMPVVSAQTDARIEGYFRREWKLAVDRSHDLSERAAFLFPIVIDDTLEARADVPDAFRQVQWTRLHKGEATASFVSRVAGLLNPTATPPEGSAGRTPTAPPIRVEREQNRHVWFSLGLFALIVVLGSIYYLLDRPHQGSDPSKTPEKADVGEAVFNIPEKSIAVLPFVDMSEKHDQEYFGDGIAEEVLNLLVRVPTLKVIGRTSSFHFKGTSTDLRDVGARLGARFIVEGSVRRSDDHIRVTAQLVDVRDGAHRWSQNYDRSGRDAIALEGEIATGITRALQLTVDDVLAVRVATTSEAAYDVYLQGIHALDQGSQQNAERAVAAFQRAMELDPHFARAAVGLARAYNLLGANAWWPPREVFPRGIDAANRAIELDSSIPSAYAIRAQMKSAHYWDWAGAREDIARAMALGGGAETIQAAGGLAATLGDWPRALQLLEPAVGLDPLNPDLRWTLSVLVYMRSMRYSEAEASLNELLRISPSFGVAHYYLGLSQLCQGKLDEALASMSLETLSDGKLEGSAMVLFAMGRKRESDAALEKAIFRNGDSWPSEIARVYAYRNERDRAIYWLERAYAQRDEDLYFIKGEPVLHNLEADPRYHAFLRKMKLPE